MYHLMMSLNIMNRCSFITRNVVRGVICVGCRWGEIRVKIKRNEKNGKKGRGLREEMGKKIGEWKQWMGQEE